MAYEDSPSIMETIELGDTVVFRCGTTEIVSYKRLRRGDSFPYTLNEEDYTKHGKYFSRGEHCLDIVDVIKKEHSPRTEDIKRQVKLEVLTEMINGLEKIREELL